MTNHADLIAALRIPMDVTLPCAPELDEYDEQRKAAADALEAIQKSNEVWRKNSIETWSAMRAMRDAINEYTPMPSLESDLLQGPENSVFCANIAEAVIVAIVAIEAVCNETTAAAYVAAYEVTKSWYHNVGKGTPYAEIEAITPQSARDWLAKREAKIRADERAKVIEDAYTKIIEEARTTLNGVSEYEAETCADIVRTLHTDASRAIPIKEKDNE